jgi:hypothetical protein
MAVQSVQSTCHADCADRTVHTGDMAAPTDDMWQLREVTRGRQIWTYGHTTGPIRR